MSQTGPPIPLVAGGTVQVPASLGPGQVIAGVVLANLSPFALQVQSGVGQTWVPPYDAMPFAQTQLGTIAVTAVSVGPGYSGTASILPTYYGQGETLPPETPLTAAALAAAIQGIVSVAVTGGTIDVLDGDVSVVGGQGGVVNVSTQTPPVSVGVLTLDSGQTSVQLTAPVDDAWTGVVVDVNPPAYNPGTPVSFVASSACYSPSIGSLPQVQCPSSVLAGDTGLALVAGAAGSVSSSGWTLIAIGASENLQVFYRLMQAGDAGNTFIFNAPGSSATVDLSVYRGVTAVGPTGVNHTSLTAPSVVANASGDWLVCLWESYVQGVPSGSGPFSLNVPGGMTSDLNQGTNTTSSLADARAIAHLALAAGGGTATQTATYTYTGTGTPSLLGQNAAAVILYGPDVPNPLPYTVTVEIDGVLGITESVTRSFFTSGQIVLPVPGNITSTDEVSVLVTASAAPAGNIEVAAVGALLGAGAQFVQLINEPERASGNILKANVYSNGTILTVPAGRVWKGTLTVWAWVGAAGLSYVQIITTFPEVTAIASPAAAGGLLFASVNDVYVYGGITGQTISFGALNVVNQSGVANGVLIA